MGRSETKQANADAAAAQKESAAQAREARSSAWVPRGPAPTRMASSVRVRRTTCTTYSTN